MFRSEVWISAAATPRLVSAAVTARTARLAEVSADVTEAPLTCTVRARVSWFGTPVTVPVPVTVILPACCEDAVSRADVTPGPPDDDPVRPAPRLKAPTSNAAAATPMAAERYPGAMLMAMGRLL